MLFTQLLECASSAGIEPLAFFEKVVEDLPIALTVTDKAGCTVFANKKGKQLLRIPTETQGSKAVEWFRDFGCFDPRDPSVQIPLDQLPGVKALLGKPASAYLIFRTEGMRAYGEYETGVLVLLQSTPWRTTDGDVGGVVSVFQEAQGVLVSAPGSPPGEDVSSVLLRPALPRRNPHLDLPSYVENALGKTEEAATPEQELHRLRETVAVLRGRRNGANIEALEDGLSKVRSVLRQLEPQSAK